MANQKSAEKRPTVVLTQRQKNKKARKLGYVRATYFPINSQSVLHVVISIKVRSASGVAASASVVAK